MSDINSVTLVGRLTDRPVIRYTPSGTPVTTLRIANNTFIKTPDGQTQAKPNFFNVVVWGKSAENCAKYLDKGRQIAIQGRLEYRSWTDQTGKKRSTIEIIAQRVQFIGGTAQQIPESEELEEEERILEPETDLIQTESEETETGQLNEFEEPISDDEIPF